MKKIMFVSLFILLLVFSSSAYSAEKGWYMAGSFGLAFPEDGDGGAASGLDLPAGTSYSINVDYHTGYFIKLAPGYNFGSFRLEGELTYLTADIGNITESLTGGETPVYESTDVRGSDTTTTSFLLNGYYDFLKGNTIQPYITAGIGYARTKTHVMVLHDADSVFAYQAGAGISYNVNENVIVDFGYRYYGTSDIEFDVTDLAGVAVKFSNSGHSVLLGARYNF
jgi:opacity protein-like surface antigen